MIGYKRFGMFMMRELMMLRMLVMLVRNAERRVSS